MKHLLRYKEAAKKIDPEENFMGYIADIFVELKEKGFYWYVNNDKVKTTYTIDLKYRGPKRSNKWWNDAHITEFKWSDVKEQISMLVGYIEDVYKKADFNEFSTTLRNRMRNKRREERIVKAYNLKDFQNKLEDTDEMESIHIRCLVRFK